MKEYFVQKKKIMKFGVVKHIFVEVWFVFWLGYGWGVFVLCLSELVLYCLSCTGQLFRLMVLRLGYSDMQGFCFQLQCFYALVFECETCDLR